jgi:thioredoxin-like negative regulator of GroEL
MSIPTVYLFKDGKQISSFMGFRPKEAIVQWIKTNA